MKLTDTEKLKLENIALRKDILALQQREIERVEFKTFNEICSRIGEDPTNVALNYITGEITIINKGTKDNEKN